MTRPNWCQNSLIVTKGDPKIIFESVHTESSAFDFNTLVPMPADIGDRMVVDEHGYPTQGWRGGQGTGTAAKARVWYRC